ncbi:unnamed protein product, partial [Urochloa humidicola]
ENIISSTQLSAPPAKKLARSQATLAGSSERRPAGCTAAASFAQLQAVAATLYLSLPLSPLAAPSTSPPHCPHPCCSSSGAGAAAGASRLVLRQRRRAATARPRAGKATDGVAVSARHGRYGSELDLFFVFDSTPAAAQLAEEEEEDLGGDSGANRAILPTRARDPRRRRLPAALGTARVESSMGSGSTRRGRRRARRRRGLDCGRGGCFL